MKQFLLLYFILALNSSARSQDNIEFQSTDRKILAIPTSATSSTAAIAAFIQSNFKEDKDKFRAMYTWVASNIKYDTDSMYTINWSGGPVARVTEALRRRKGVCENYAAIFNDIALKCGLVSFIVDGYTRQGGTIDRIGHSWCAVSVKDEWFLCDPTWDKDAQGNTNYFMVTPANFIESHMPFDPMWQLLDHPVTHQEFRQGIADGKKNVFYNYKDSIAAYKKLPELQQLQATSARMQEAGHASQLIKNRIDYTNMRIMLIYEDRDMHLYNDAVADLNRATTAFNSFVQYRNTGFVPARTNTQLTSVLDTVTTDISSAYKKINALSKFNDQYDPSELKERLDGLSKKLNDQRDFLKRYFAGSVADRSKLFYQ